MKLSILIFITWIGFDILIAGQTSLESALGAVGASIIGGAIYHYWPEKKGCN